MRDQIVYLVKKDGPNSIGFLSLFYIGGIVRCFLHRRFRLHLWNHAIWFPSSHHFVSSCSLFCRSPNPFPVTRIIPFHHLCLTSVLNVVAVFGGEKGFRTPHHCLHSLEAQVHEGKEPALSFSIFQKLIIFKGGISLGYKTFTEEQGMIDETYEENNLALFQVQGASPDNMQAIQVDPVSSLNSSYCYILQTGASIFTWIGSLSSAQDHNLLDRMAELLNPTWQPISVREGGEPDIFWDTLGGRAKYPRGKEIQKYIEDPHLFVLHITGGT